MPSDLRLPSEEPVGSVGPVSSLVEVPPNAFYLPSPVTLMGTVSGDGTPDISTMSAVGVLCLAPPIIGVGVKPECAAYRNLTAVPEFSIGVAGQDQLELTDLLTTRNAGKMSFAESRLERSGPAGLPYLSGTPIVMFCRVVGSLGHGELSLDASLSHHIVLGELTGCLADPRWIEDDKVKLEKIPLLLYLNRIYATSGQPLATQRFTDDPEQRAAKMREYRGLSLPGLPGSGPPPRS